MMTSSYFGNYLTTKYKDIVPNVGTLVDIVRTYFGTFELSQDNWAILYSLLLTKYGNAYTSSTAEPFKAKLALTIYSKAPVYFRKKEIMEQIIALSDDEIRTTVQKYTHAENPGELINQIDDYVNSTDKTYNETNKIIAYENYLSQLKSYEDQFLSEFKNLFLKVVAPQTDLFYESEEY